MTRFALPVVSVLCGVVGCYAGGDEVQPAPQSGPVTTPKATPLPAPPPVSADTAAALSERIEAIIAHGVARFSRSEMVPDVFRLARTLNTDQIPAAIATARNSKHSFGGRVAQLLAGYWAEVDLDAARDWMLELPPSEQSDFAGEIAQVWGQLRPAEMLGWFEALPDEAKKRLSSQVRSIIAGSVSRIAPDRAVKLLFSLPRGSSPLDFSSRGRSDHDPVAVHLAEAIRNWAEIAPRRAADFALALPASSGRSAAVEGAVSAWATRAPAAAGVWIDTIADPVVAARARSAYATGLAYRDPLGAAEYVASLPASEINEKALVRVAEIWATKDLNGAIAWLREMPVQRQRATIFDAMIKTASLTDVAKVAEAIIAAQGFGFVSTGTAMNVAHDLTSLRGHQAGFEFAQKLLREPWRGIANGAVIWAWILQAPVEVEKWALAQPETTLRERALARLATHRVRTNPGQVMAWIETLPTGASRDAAIFEALRTPWLLGWDQAEALTSLASDRGKARKEFIRTLHGFTNAGTAGAGQWVEQTTRLSAEEKATILAAPGGNP